jgi:hypothetical protein
MNLLHAVCKVVWYFLVAGAVSHQPNVGVWPVIWTAVASAWATKRWLEEDPEEGPT